MAEPVGSLRIEVAANVAQIIEDMGKIKGVVNSASNQMARGMGDFAKGMNAAIGTIFNLRNAAIVAAATGMVALAKKSIDAGDEIAKAAQKIGISTDKLQELRYAANSAGVTTEDFDQALLQLSKRLGDTSGDVTEVSRALGKLGLSMAELKGKDAAEVINIIADRIRLVPDAMERARISTDLFGKAGQQLLPVLMSGSAGFAALAAEARKLGIVISADTLKKAEAANDEFGRIGKSLQAAGINISVGFLPALKEIRAVVTSQGFQDGVKDLADNFGRLIKWMVDNRDTIEVVAGALAMMKIGRAFGTGGAIVGAGVGAFLGGFDVAGRMGDAKDVAKAIQGIEDELATLQSQQKFVGNQITNTPDGSIIGALATQSDKLSARIAVLKQQLAGLKNSSAPIEPAKVTVNPASLVPVMPEAAKAIEDLQFKTRILRNDFAGLAEGFPELAHGLKIFGDTTYGAFSAAVTSVEKLPKPLRELNDAMLSNNAQKLIAQTRSEQETANIVLARAVQLYTAGKLSADEYGRAVGAIRFPALTRAINDAGNLNKQMDTLAVSGLTSCDDALADVLMVA